MKWKKSWTFNKYLKSFFLMSIAISLVLLVPNMIIIADVRRTLNDSYKSSVKQIASFSGASIFEMKRLAEIICKDEDFTSYNIRNNIDIPGNIILEMEKVKKPFELLSSIGLVYRNSPYAEINYTIYTDSGRFSAAEYCRLVCNGGMTPETLLDIIQTVAAPRFFQLQGLGDQQLFVLPLPVGFISSPGVLIFKTNDKTYIQDYLPEYFNVVVTDQDSQILSLSGPIFTGKNISGSFRHEQYRDQIIFSEINENYGLNIYLMIDRNRYYQPYYNSIWTFSLLLLLVFMIGLVLSYFLAWRNYLPIHLLINKIRPSGDSASQGKINELESLDRAFEHLREERDRFKKETTEEQILVRNHLLAALLHNQYPELKTGYASDFWNEFATDGYDYCAITVIIDDYPHLIITHNIKEQWLIKSTLCDILEKSCEAFGKGYAMDTDFGGGIVAAIRCRKNENTALATFSVCQQLRKTVRDNFDLTLTCAIGQTVQDACDVSRSYTQSIQYIKYRFFLGWDIIITPELAQSFESHVRPQTIKSKSWVGMFIQKIRSGSTRDIRQDLLKIFANTASEKQIAAFNSTYFDILSEISELVLESSLDKRDSFIDRLDILYENRYETVDEAIDTLVYFCEELSQSFFRIQKSQISKDIYLKILTDIDQNYNNKNLSLSMIAEKFSLNSSYLTRYFKEHNGVPLMQYIDRLRFTKAKELLIRTDYSIREIVDRVGYTDEANFIRKFKKTEGISSSRFRSIYRNDMKSEQ